MSVYVRNLWYMAAWEEEIEGSALLGRTLLDERLVIFRKEDGGYAVMDDRCPHRLAPLHQGARTGDTIACPYHGLEFDTAGKCTRNPFSDLIPPHAKLRTYPAVGRHGIIWFWPGDPALADPATIPDFSPLETAGPTVRGRMRFDANYEVITDNLLDLSHIEFIHRDSFRTGGKIFGGNYEGEETDDGAVWSKWSLFDTKRPAWLTHLPEDARFDEWIDMRWHAPASMLLRIGSTFAGTAREAAPVPEMVNPHIITPETATSSHYFFTRMPGEDAEALAHQIFEVEDRPMLETIQQTMGDKDFWDWKPVILSVDAAAIRARRRLMKLRRGEQGAPAHEAAA